MDQPDLRTLFAAVAEGSLQPEEALAQIQHAGQEDLGFAVLDHDRAKRCGFAEVVFAENKQPEHVEAIVESLLERTPGALVTRATPATCERLLTRWPDAECDPAGRTLLVGSPPPPCSGGRVAIVTAGTSDLPVAHEALLTAKALGVEADLVTDVGVAGLHRLVSRLERLRSARVIIVVAGMEGALPSVVGGLVDVPVVAVPTSVGYGSSLGGLAALLGMLNSCASGLSVVNIDNGFGASAAAARIVRSYPSQDCPPSTEESA